MVLTTRRIIGVGFTAESLERSPSGCDLQLHTQSVWFYAGLPHHGRAKLTDVLVTGASGVGLSLAYYIFSEK